MPKENWALREPEGHHDTEQADEPQSLRGNGEADGRASEVQTVYTEKGAQITNGRIWAKITRLGKITVYHRDGRILLEEYCRNRRDLLDPKCSAIEVEARELRPTPGGDYHLTMRFESQDPEEKIYGMGQYQQPYLNLKGLDLELAHRNSQASVPFAISSLGYGFLWNNPAVGRAVLGKNIMSFEAYSTKALDYWVVAGDSPAQIEEAYAAVTGTVPMMPEYVLGFWQCKLRYQTQEELLEVAREYVWGKAKKNYYDKGIRVFWLDEAEPEYSVYDFDIYRYYRGTNLQVGNLYPVEYARAFYEGMEQEGQGQIVNLLRCAWAGSQKYGALVWSGDIASSFESMRNQLAAGLNMGLAGIPWWTTDIGGFHGGNPEDPAFRELFARWFAWGAFCPVMRLHGDREPRQPQQGTTGGP
jgi:alpha-glucosidase (family GH31 glycosyl hydrolase)